jgi:Protein of unknown function (DUF3307)
MNGAFTYEEASLLIRLLIAHIITDFLLQTGKGVMAKKNKLLKAGSFWLHGLYTAIFAAFFMWDKLLLPVLALITFSHLLIDYCKLILMKKIDERKWQQRDLWLFITDQIMHILILIIAWLLLIDGFGKMKIVLNEWPLNYLILLSVLGYLTAIGPVTYLIKFLTLKWADEITVENNSLKDAGKWIGILERIIVITLVMIQQYTAIGFLVTAKSILRLIDKPEPPFEIQQQKGFSSRKHTEYVLIGTFLSFGAAILIGLIINWLLIV